METANTCKKFDKEFSADVVVVGEGMGGLCAALSCVQAGLDTAVVTASKKPVGRGGSVFATYSKVMKEQGYPRPDVESFYLEELAAASFSVDQRKWFAVCNHSEAAMDWLVDILRADGVEVGLEDANDDDEHSPTYQPPGTHTFIKEGKNFAGLGINYALETIEKKFLALGGRVFRQTAGRSLEKTDGRVTALIASDAEGKTLRFGAKKAVILATGDFSGNKEMMEKYCPRFARYFNRAEQDYDIGFSVGGLFRGEGHRMALDAGAAWQKTYPNAVMVQGSRTGANMPYGSHRGLRLNVRGERYCNEDCNGAYTALSAMMQPEEKAFAIWGSNYAADIEWHLKGDARGASHTPEDMIARWEDAISKGRMVKGDTLEEVIAKLGLPEKETLATIERYNALCRAGKDEDFHKKSKYLQGILTAPFYGGSVGDKMCFTVLGGPRTDSNLRVCTEDDRPIPGLYCAGSMIGDMFANCYNFRIPGHNYGSCLTFGYLMGPFIAKNE